MYDVLKRKLELINQIVIGLDPGETTGVCVLTAGKACIYQIATKEIGPGGDALCDILEAYDTAAVVCEDYRVYSWHSEDHKWAALHTPQIIGVIRYLCHKQNMPITMQMAQVAKVFCTDEKLKGLGMWVPGVTHGRDAARHAVYHALFAIGKVHQPEAKETEHGRSDEASREGQGQDEERNN
jgi:hypothetical protein